MINNQNVHLVVLLRKKLPSPKSNQTSVRIISRKNNGMKMLPGASRDQPGNFLGSILRSRKVNDDASILVAPFRSRFRSRTPEPQQIPGCADHYLLLPGKRRKRRKSFTITKRRYPVERRKRSISDVSSDKSERIQRRKNSGFENNGQQYSRRVMKVGPGYQHFARNPSKKREKKENIRRSKPRPKRVRRQNKRISKKKSDDYDEECADQGKVEVKMKVGCVPFGRLQVLNRRLGAGSYGYVFLAEDLATKRKVAVKRVDLHHEQVVEREIEWLMTLEHEHIVKCFGYRKTEDLLRREIDIFLEYCDKGTINSFFKEKYKSPEEKIRGLPVYLKQILEGLHYLHKQKLVHRDIKPSNILILSTDDDFIVKLVDFGFMKELRSSGNSDLGSFTKGTLCYLAPQVVHQALNPTEKEYKNDNQRLKNDIWSLGMSLVELVVEKDGMMKFLNINEEYSQCCRLLIIQRIAALRTSKKKLELPKEISDKNLRDLISRCLEIDAEKRDTAEELLKHPFLDLVKNKEKKTLIKKEEKKKSIKKNSLVKIPIERNVRFGHIENYAVIPTIQIVCASPGSNESEVRSSEFDESLPSTPSYTAESS